MQNIYMEVRMDYSNITFLILAGGKSSRMGANKSDLMYKNQTFLEFLINKAKQLGFLEILVSDYKGKKCSVPNIVDELTNRGPLGGIYSCLSKANNPYCFILSVDVPFIEPDTIQELIQFHFLHKPKATLLKNGERIEPLIGIYDTDVYQNIYQVIKYNSAPVFRFLDSIPYQIYPFSGDSVTVTNINTMELYKSTIEYIG